MQPITKEQYSAWKDHPCTVQLIEDLQFHSLEIGADVRLFRGSKVVSEQCLMLAALNDVTDSVASWTPESLGEVAE